MVIIPRQQVRRALVTASLPIRSLPFPLARPPASDSSGLEVAWTGNEEGAFGGSEPTYGNHAAPIRAFDSSTVVLTGRSRSVTFRNTHAFDADRRIMYEKNVSFDTLPVSLQRLQRPNATHSNVAYVSNTWPTNFYHWLCLTLPLLRFYGLAGIDVDQVYVGDRLTGWQARSLELAGISPDQVVTGACRAETAHVAISTRNGGAVSPDQIEWVRSTLVKTEPMLGDKRLFVGRGETTTRRMIDEEIVATALEREFGFEYVTTSAMTLDEEIEMFAKAESIVAPYGAALTNVLFAPRGTKVLELQAFDADFSATTAYLELSRVLGNPHALLRGEPTPVGNTEIATDIKVSVDVVLRHVEQMLSAN
ncbi:MAG: capsular polysaccharide biosynthesis protein [Verrucomicrobiales bacterium]|jgi:capsular polysaccharide biosynthesis protein